MKLTFNSQTASGIAAKYVYEEFYPNGGLALPGDETVLQLDGGRKVHSLSEIYSTVKQSNPKVLGEDKEEVDKAIAELCGLPAEASIAQGAEIVKKYQSAFLKRRDGLYARLAPKDGTPGPAKQAFADTDREATPMTRSALPTKASFTAPTPATGKSAEDNKSEDELDVPRLNMERHRSYTAGMGLNATATPYTRKEDPMRLKAQRDEARGRVETLQKELSQRSEQVDGKEMELQRALERERKMKNDYKPLSEENSTLRNDLRRSETRLAEANRQLAEMRSHMRKLQGKEEVEASEEPARAATPPLPALSLKREKSQQEQALDTTIDVMQSHIEKLELQRAHTQQQVATVEETRRKQGVQLKDLEDAKIKQFDQITKLKEELDQAQHLNIQQSKALEELKVKLAAAGEVKAALKTPDLRIDYPPDETVIQNLLRAQIEFYFSNYNLKRDKPLLEKMVQETPAAKKGFLSIDEIEKLPKVRQLAPDRTTILQALDSSKYLKTSASKLMVGRPNFTEPERQEFPFRRTVFVYGLPADADDTYINKMCSSFGSILKIKFDAGPDTLDRHIGRRLLNKPRVKKIYSTCSKHAELTYTVQHPRDYSVFKCSWCMRSFQTMQGFYHDQDWGNVVCLQCSARRAESQLSEFEDHRKRGIPTLSSELLGDDANRKGLCDYRTALVVFESQRQASKCVYVRSRLGYEACFATHFHHYSKLKKEQVNTYEPAFRLMEKPPDDVNGFEQGMQRRNMGISRPQLSRFQSHQPTRSKPRQQSYGGRQKGGRQAGMMDRLYSEHQYENNSRRFNGRGRGRGGPPPGLGKRQPQFNYDGGSGPPGAPLRLSRHASAPIRQQGTGRLQQTSYKKHYRQPRPQRGDG